MHSFLNGSVIFHCVHMYHNFFIHSSVNGHLGSFHVLDIVNSAAMNNGTHVFFSILVSSVSHSIFKVQLNAWCWEGLGAGGEGDDRGWDGWMASLTGWAWVWVNSRSWWWTGRPGVLRFMGLQRVGHDWATQLNWTEVLSTLLSSPCSQESTGILSNTACIIILNSPTSVSYVTILHFTKVILPSSSSLLESSQRSP